MQQATCAHSGADTGTSPGNFCSFFASRRSVLLGLAAAPAASLAINAPAIAAIPRSPWDEAEARYNAACKAACDYFQNTYDPLWKQFEADAGPCPPRFFEHTAKDGSIARHTVTRNADFPPFACFDPNREAQARLVAWSDRYLELEKEPRWKSASEHLDRLYDEEYDARKALMATPAPNHRALALKVSIALDNDEITSPDRDGLLADVIAQRLSRP